MERYREELACEVMETDSPSSLWTSLRRPKRTIDVQRQFAGRFPLTWGG